MCYLQMSKRKYDETRTTAAITVVDLSAKKSEESEYDMLFDDDDDDDDDERMCFNVA